MPYPISAKLHMLPDMIIIGAMKCGTTSLFRYLEEHPDFFGPKKKEIHYFDYKYDNGLAWYRRQFPTKLKKWKCRLKGRRIITGEATPYYMFHPHACKRVASILPNVKLIALLRNPVDRAYSHYHNKIRGEKEKLTFEQAIESEPRRLAGELEKMLEDESYFSFHHGYHGYLSRGIYVEQIKAWHAHIPQEQLLILDSETFFANPQGVYDKVCVFLGLSPYRIREFKINNPGDYQQKMPAALRKKLIDYFAPYNEELFDYLGMNFRLE